MTRAYLMSHILLRNDIFYNWEEISKHLGNNIGDIKRYLLKMWYRIGINDKISDKKIKISDISRMVTVDDFDVIERNINGITVYFFIFPNPDSCESQAKAVAVALCRDEKRYITMEMFSKENQYKIGEWNITENKFVHNNLGLLKGNTVEKFILLLEDILKNDDRHNYNCNFLESIDEKFIEEDIEKKIIEQNINKKDKSRNIEKLLIQFKNTYKKNFGFQWNFENGLRYVSDDSLELAYTIISKARISLNIEDNDIAITNNIVNLCSLENTTEDLLDILKNSNALIKPSYGNFTVKKDCSIDRICYGCKYQKCPKHLAAYIFYLINKGIIKEKLEDRRKFRENNKINDIYSFEWDFDNIICVTSDDIYDFCYEIAKNNLVYVNRYLDKNNKIKISSALNCNEFKKMYVNIENLKSITKSFEKWNNHIAVENKFDYVEYMGFECSTHECGLPLCPLKISGIIYYLITSGQEDALIKDRKYYNEHQEEIEKDLNDIICEYELEQKSNIKESIDDLKEYESKISNINDLISYLSNPNQKSLHCTIEGNDIEERKNIVKKITIVLRDSKKLEDGNGIEISLQNLAASNVYETSRKLEEYDANGMPYGSENEIRYTVLKENYVYAITGLDEFIKDYRKYKNVNGVYIYEEVRKKQFSHIIDLLTEISKANYIILEGTNKEIDELLTLDPKLQFVYQNYRFKLPEMSLDETFGVYTQHLNSSVFRKLKDKEKEHKQQFMEYASLNKNFIPFTNKELAVYLAMYSNSKGEIVFPDNIYKRETVDEALKNIVGLYNVKKKVKEFEKYMLFKAKAESQGLKIKSANMHMLFTGNPGTSKTTVARIMMKMLYDMGIVKENKLIEVERKDLIAEYVGQTAIKTSEVISRAMGGVLFIDEAYSISSYIRDESGGDYGAECVATLIKAMEDHKDELVIIYAGYKDEMKSFIDSNPGIASRIGYTFDFPDYNVDELLAIFHKKIENMGFSYTKECDLELRKIFLYFSKRKAFGNGRFIDKIIQEVILKHAINGGKNIKKIESKDIPTIKDINNSGDTDITTEDLLKDIIGLEELKEKIKEFENYVRFIKKAEKKNINISNQNLHMLFTGNPGTGKTTIARVMAKILFNAGIIHENKVIEVERKDLVAEYVGKTSQKTYEVIEKAMGGILFIDEAYSLATGTNNDFGGEAIATLIKAMEDHKGEFVVIFAGYKKEMTSFINMNSGIASRIGYVFDFKDYNREELSQILYKKIEKSNLKIEKKAKDKILEIMNYFCNVENIGNGRFADRVFQEIILKHAKNNDKRIEIIKENDIPTIKEITISLFNGDSMINPEDLTDEDMKTTAIHEVGHAFVRYKLFKTPGIVKITIKPEGNGTLGYVENKIIEGKYTNGKKLLLNRIKVLLAGMGSEQVFNGEFDSGASSDLRNATRIAKRMVTIYGMSKLGYAQIENPDGAMAIRVQEEINAILAECYESTLKIINENKKDIEKIVEFLLKEKEITGEQFLEILNNNLD